MRIISGKYKGKKLEFEIEGTRPTMDRVKESCIAMIQNSIKESTILDLFCGTGSLGLELLSNGSKKAYFVDNNSKALKVLEKNIQKLNIEEEYILIENDYLKALEMFHKKNIQFDIILLDPPYQKNYIDSALKKIVDYNLLTSNGKVVCEYEGEVFDNDVLTLIKEKRYGGKGIKIYQKTS